MFHRGLKAETYTFVLFFSLLIAVPPAKVTILGSTSGAENTSLSLSCFTSSSNPPVYIRWWLGAVELGDTVVTITDVSANLHVIIL